MKRRTALITGSGSGIGRGLAFGLAEDGYRIISADMNEEHARETAGMVRENGGEADAFLLDVAGDESISAFKDAVEGRDIDVLINNAGLQFVAPLEEFPDDTWEYMIRVMLVGSARMMKAVLPGMRKNGFGRIINMGSIHSLVASPYKTAYTSAKHGLLGLSKVVALETADCDITVNTICPAYVKTPLVEKQIANQAKSHNISTEVVEKEIMLKPMPKKAFVTIEELIGITKFFISDAARNITGQTITVDGGWTAQ